MGVAGVNTIQTYHELGAPTSHRKVLNGQQPSTEPFSVLLPEVFSRFGNVLSDKVLVMKFNHGVLLLANDCINLVGDSEVVLMMDE